MTKKTAKFLFDLNNFDEGPIETQIESIEEKQEEQEERPPPPPTFTEEELEAAKKQAFHEGEQKGITDTNDKHDKQKQYALQQIVDLLPTLLVDEEKRITQFEAESLKLCYAIFKKTIPSILSATSKQELYKNIKEIIEQHTSHAHIEIQLHPDQISALTGELNTLDNAKNIAFTANENTAIGTCKIKWPSGGAYYSHEELIENIEKELVQILTNNAIEIPTDTSNIKKQPNNNTIEDSPQTIECDTIENNASDDNEAEAAENTNGENP